MFFGIEEYKNMKSSKMVDVSNHAGYKKLEELLKQTDFTQEQKENILLQYHFLISDSVHGITKGDVETYIINNHPEIVSFKDIYPMEIPYLKFIWTFRKEDEKLIDKCVDIVGYDNVTKYDCQYENENILVLIVNVKIDCEWTANCNQIKNPAVNKAREYGYELFSELERRMIKHGMCWYTYGNLQENFSGSCELFPVRSLVLKSRDDGWAKDGYREDLDHAFRSTWEANIARLLNYKNITWKYEPYFVNLKPPAYMNLDNNNLANMINYLPDFELEDGTIIEVKGFWDSRSKLNVSQFMEQHPDAKYLVIDSDMYRCIDRKYRQIIPNWETKPVENNADIIQVVGITIPQRKPYVANLKIGDVLEIVREPDNPYDSRAIRVNDSNGNQVGYFAKDCNCIFAPKIDKGFKYQIVIEKKMPKLLQCKIKLLNTNEMILPEIFM